MPASSKLIGEQSYGRGRGRKMLAALERLATRTVKSVAARDAMSRATVHRRSRRRDGNVIRWRAQLYLVGDRRPAMTIAPKRFGNNGQITPVVQPLQQKYFGFSETQIRAIKDPIPCPIQRGVGHRH
jgi:hypothetical protein